MDNETVPQSQVGLIVGSGAEIAVSPYEDGRGVRLTITEDTHQWSLSFFDALPLMTLANVLGTDASVRRFVDAAHAKDAQTLPNPFHGRVNGKDYVFTDQSRPSFSIDDDATHPAQPPEPYVRHVTESSAEVRCPTCDLKIVAALGTTNIERLASATLGYAAHWAREHGKTRMTEQEMSEYGTIIDPGAGMTQR